MSSDSGSVRKGGRRTSASGNQVRLALDLFERRGYPTEEVSGVHRTFGATEKDVGLSVGAWVEGLDQRSIGALIDRLFFGPRFGQDGGEQAGENGRCNVVPLSPEVRLA